MKHIKRWIGLLTVIVMICNISATAAARTFDDVVYYCTEYKDSISFVADNGYMVGNGDDKFSPDGMLTRAMLVTILYSMQGKPAYSENVSFPDVKQGDWFYDAVCWAYSNDIVAGNGQGNFEPYSYIIKQDAILILYKYMNMQNTENVVLSAEETEDILFGYVDSANISSYAYEAVAWAVEREIFPLTNKSALSPKANLTRADMALLITKYGLNVEHIVYGRDDYGFNNSYVNFTDDFYFMTDEHYDRLWNRVLAMYPEDSDMKEYCEWIMNKSINNSSEPWSGSCYGMALTTILDKMGKIDLNGNFAPGATLMNDVDIREGNTLAESAINYYQVSQNIPICGKKPKIDVKNVSQEGVLEDVIARCQDEKGLKLFCYYYGYYGHAIVVYDIEQISDNEYRMKAYDNRDKREDRKEGKPIYITINTEDNTCIVHTTYKGKPSTEKVESLELITDFSKFDYLDLDDEMNQGVFNNMSHTPEKIVVFNIELLGDLVITNAKGKQLIINGVSLSGDMEVFAYNIICNGTEHPAEMVICVEASDSYFYEAYFEKQDIDLTVWREKGQASIEGTNVKTVQIDAENRMLLTGNEMEYEIVYEDSHTEEIEIVRSNELQQNLE